VDQGKLIGNHLQSKNLPLFGGSGSAGIVLIGSPRFSRSRGKGAKVGGVRGGLAGHGVSPQERELPTLSRTLLKNGECDSSNLGTIARDTSVRFTVPAVLEAIKDKHFQYASVA
jgi:hypothetical protein